MGGGAWRVTLGVIVKSLSRLKQLSTQSTHANRFKTKTGKNKNQKSASSWFWRQEVRGSRCGQGWILLGAPRGNPSQASPPALGAAGKLLRLLVCSCVP